MSSESHIIRMRPAFLAAVGVLLTSLTATRAESAAAPDSMQIALVRFAALSFRDVRVVTDGKKLLAHHVVVSPDGLRLPLDLETDFTPFFASSPQIRLVRWSEVESIHVRRGSSGIGPVAGGIVGLAIGSLIYIVAGTAQAEASVLTLTPQHVSPAPIVIGLVGGAALGFLLDRPGPWKTVYP